MIGLAGVMEKPKSANSKIFICTTEEIQTRLCTRNQIKVTLVKT